jgi:hypothetical protein
MDGSLWKVIDTTRFYKIIKDDQLRVLGTAASGFLRYANFRYFFFFFFFGQMQTCAGARARSRADPLLFYVVK